LIDGIKITVDSFEGALKKNKISKIKIDVGTDIFDSKWHQALVQQVDDSVPEGTVIDVARTGYTIGDRLLQPALVVVSKKGS
jgi:molecular chaperone GrpE